MIIVFFDTAAAGATSTSATRVELFRREFYSYSFDLLPSGLTVKTVFLQAYIDQCESCSLQEDSQIMAKLCGDSACASPLTNNSVTGGKAIYVNLGLFDPILLFNFSIQSLQLWDDGQDLTNSTVSSGLADSTGPAMQLTFNASTTAGLHKYELRVYLNAKPVVLDAAGNLVYDSKDYYSKRR